MTDEYDREPPDADTADAVAQLIRTAGRRMDPPSAAYERALTAATAAWETKVRRRTHKRWAVGVAASVLLAVIAVLVSKAPQGVRTHRGKNRSHHRYGGSENGWRSLDAVEHKCNRFAGQDGNSHRREAAQAWFWQAARHFVSQMRRTSR